MPTILPTVPSSGPKVVQPTPVSDKGFSTLPPSGSSPSVRPAGSVLAHLPTSTTSSASARITYYLHEISVVSSASTSLASIENFSAIVFSEPFDSASKWASGITIGAESTPSLFSAKTGIKTPTKLVFSFAVTSVG